MFFKKKEKNVVKEEFPDVRDIFSYSYSEAGFTFSYELEFEEIDVENLTDGISGLFGWIEQFNKCDPHAENKPLVSYDKLFYLARKWILLGQPIFLEKDLYEHIPAKFYDYEEFMDLKLICELFVWGNINIIASEGNNDYLVENGRHRLIALRDAFIDLNKPFRMPVIRTQPKKQIK